MFFVINPAGLESDSSTFGAEFFEYVENATAVANLYNEDYTFRGEAPEFVIRYMDTEGNIFNLSHHAITSERPSDFR